MTIVKDILITEQTPTYTLRSKTGWARCWDFLATCDPARFSPQGGWTVGYVERQGTAYFFAATLDIRTDVDAAARIPLTTTILRSMQIIE